MSRINKYQESISKFIIGSSCLPIKGESDNVVTDPQLKTFLEKMIQESDKYVSILLLTIINNQNRKNKVNVHGYYAATAVEFLKYLQHTRDHHDRCMEEYGDCVNDLVPYKLSSSILKSVISNLEVTKRYVKNAEKYQKIISLVLDLVSEESPVNGVEKKIEIEYKNSTTSDNLYRFYLNEKPELQPAYLGLKLIKKESLVKLFDDSVCRIFRVAATLGWMLTASDEAQLSQIQKVGRLFATMYQIGSDFAMVDEDLKYASEHTKTTRNYVINCGLQRAYDDYMWYKQRLITNLMMMDLYTRTMKEMIEKIDEWVDDFVATTNPDIKSSYSNIQSFAESK